MPNNINKIKEMDESTLVFLRQKIVIRLYLDCFCLYRGCSLYNSSWRFLLSLHK